MQNQMQIFENKEFGRVRVLDINGEPWFVGKDVAEALGYERPTKAVQDHVDSEDKDAIPIQDSIGRKQKTPVINESGLYSLILSSKLSTAKQFKRWVTSEVLPSLRKHGAYLFDAVLEEAAKSQDFAFELIQKLQAEKNRNEVLHDKLETLAPKAIYCDLILQSKNAIPTSLIAKDYGMTVVAFNLLLHDLRIQYKLGGTWLLYHPYAAKGYTKSRTYFISEEYSKMHTYWTQAGRLFLYEKLKGYGIVPLKESGRSL